MDNKELVKKLIDVVQLFDEFNRENFEGVYDGLNINEVHAIEFIGKNDKPNITSISSHLNITRGGATKICKRLIQKEYIYEYQIEENKKEKYFKLTPNKGNQMFEKHEEIHESVIEKDALMFESFTKTEKKVIDKFLDTLKEDLKNKQDSSIKDK